MYQVLEHWFLYFVPDCATLILGDTVEAAGGLPFNVLPMHELPCILEVMQMKESMLERKR